MRNIRIGYSQERFEKPFTHISIGQSTIACDELCIAESGSLTDRNVSASSAPCLPFIMAFLIHLPYMFGLCYGIPRSLPYPIFGSTQPCD